VRISTVILTFNSEAVIAKTLASVREISDEIYIVDSFSEDGTLAIATRYGAQIVAHPFENYAAQRNWAIDNLPLSGDWQLHLDADEHLTPALAQEIKEIKERGPGSVKGFLLARLVYFLGHPIRHGGMYPTWHLRLFENGSGRCEDRRYDQHFFVTGEVARLRHPMIDDQRNSIAEWTRRHMRWAEAEVHELRRGRASSEIVPRLTGTPIERKRALRGFYDRMPLLLRPFLLFAYRYFLRSGFLDGKPGLIFFALQTFWFRFFVDARLFELRNAAGSSEASVPAGDELHVQPTSLLGGDDAPRQR